MTNTVAPTGPESIVTSLDWSRKLQEAGWPATGHSFRWAFDDRLDVSYNDHGWIVLSTNYFEDYPADSSDLPAPIADEILRRLPHKIEQDGFPRFLECGKFQDFWSVGYWRGFDNIVNVTDATLANAAAEMWCFLKEHNLLP